MFRKIFSTLVAASVAFTPMAASSQEFVFRYKSGLSSSETPDVKYGIGNDIVAYFVSAIGANFNKEIPVATKDVVLWQMEDGALLPNGITLNARTGFISGVGDFAEKTVGLLHGFDINGNKIARAQIHFNVFLPQEDHRNLDLYTHTDEHLYEEILTGKGLSVRWVSEIPLPKGVSLVNEGRALEGYPSEEGLHDLLLTGYADGFDPPKPVATASGTLLVQDGPQFVSDIEDHFIDLSKSQTFNRMPEIERAIGTISYKLVPQSIRPVGVEFNSMTGKVSGTYKEYGLTEYFQIEARDSATGRVTPSNTFALGTLDAVGVPSYLRFKTSNLIVKKNVGFSTSKPILQDPTLEDDYFTLGAAYPLRDDLTLSRDDGSISSVSGITEAGTYYFDLEHRKGNTAPYVSTQYITVLDDLKLEYPSTPVKRLDTIVLYPKISGGPARYPVKYKLESTDLPSWLKFDEWNRFVGRVPSSQPIGKIGPFKVSVTDFYNSTPVMSEDIYIDVVERDDISGVAQDVSVQRYVSNTYYNGVSITKLYDVNGNGPVKIEILQGTLPDTMYFRYLWGHVWVFGKTEDAVGTQYKDLVIKVTDIDGDDYSWTSEPFTLTVIEPEDLAGLNGRLNFEKKWSEDIAFSATFPSLSNGFGKITYALTNDTLSLIVKDDVVSGTVAEPGIYKISYTIDDETERKPAEGVFTLMIQPEMQLLADNEYVLNRGTETPFTLDRISGLGPFEYTLVQPTFLPSNLRLDPFSGRIFGKPGAEGTWPVIVQVRDKATNATAQTEPFFDITVDAPLPFDFSYENDGVLEMTIGKGVPISPEVENDLGTVTWEHVSGDLPPDVYFMLSGPMAGSFYGTPSKIGLWKNIVIKAFDSETPGKPVVKTVSIGVQPPEKVEFKTKEFDARVDSVGTFANSANYGVGIFTYSITEGTEDYSEYIELDGLTGEIKGAFAEANTYRVSVTAKDKMNRSATAFYTINVKDKVGVSIPAEVTFDQYKTPETPPKAIPFNTIGSVVFSLAPTSAPLPGDLYIDLTTGEIKGSSDVAGIFDNIKIRVTDSFDNTHNETDLFTVVVNQRPQMTLNDQSFSAKQYDTLDVVLQPYFAIDAVTYEFEPALPDTMIFDPVESVITGHFDSVFNGSFQVKAVDSKGGALGSATATLTFDIAQRDEMTIEDVSINDKRFNTVTAQFTPAHAIGGVSYTFTPPLPEELEFYPDIGLLKGTFERVYNQTFAVIAKDSKGGDLGTDEAMLTIAIAERDKLTLTPGAPIVFKQYRDDPRTVVGTVTGEVTGRTDAPVQWTLVPSELPPGMYFDGATGEFYGKPSESMAETTYEVTVNDGLGGALGRDTKNITVKVDARDPLGISGPADFTFNQFFESYFDLVAVNPIGDFSFTVVPSLPAYFDMAETSQGVRITATPQAKFDNQNYKFTVTDGVGDKKPYDVSITVEDRVKPLIKSTALSAMLGYDEPVELKADNIIGNLSWEVTGTLPNGMYFDQATQVLRGAPTQYGKFENITLVAIDTYNGVGTRSNSVTVSLTVLQDGTPIGMIATGKVSRIDEELKTDAPVLTDVVGKAKFTATGLPTGFTIDSSTGVITGTSSSAFVADVEITVSDIIPGRETTVSVRLEVVPRIILNFNKEQDLLYNYTFEKAQVLQPDAQLLYSDAVWSIEGAENLPEGLYFDLLTGTFAGQPEEIGAFGPFTITVGDDLPGKTSFGPIWFTVLMNGDPIELVAQDLVTKVGYPVSTPAPFYDNTLGPHRYYSLDLAGTGLSLDENTGVLTGQYDDVQDITVNVSITDETLRVTSVPVNVKVLPLMVVSAPSVITINAQEQIKPIVINRQNIVGTAIWNPVAPELLPEGIIFNTATGSFEGYTDQLGEYGPIVLSSVDSLGDVGKSQEVTFKVQVGAFYLKMNGTTLPKKIKRLDTFDSEIMPLVEYQGMDESELKFTVGPLKAGQTQPPGLGIDYTTGVLKGTPSRSGWYYFDLGVSFGEGTSKITKTATFVQEVALPEIKLDINSELAKAKVDTVYGNVLFQNVMIKELENIPLSSVSWTAKTDPATGLSYPPGMSVSNNSGPNARISGTPSSSGNYYFDLTAAFKNGTDEDISVTKKVWLHVDPLLYYFKDINAGDGTSCGVNALDDTVWCAGSNGLSKHVNAQVKEYVRNRSHACWITSEDVAYCSGNNGYGQLGRGNFNSIGSPVAVVGLSGAVEQIAVGSNHSCALMNSGEVKCWGWNYYGQIGSSLVASGANGMTATPVQVDGLGPGSGVASIALGGNYSCALFSTGSAKCWGLNTVGQLGNGSMASSNVPVDVRNPDTTNKWSKLVASNWGTCGISTINKVYCWGNNTNRLQYSYNVATPRQINTTPSGWNPLLGVDIAVTNENACVITADQRVMCWGGGDHGENGNRYSSDTQTPAYVQTVEAASDGSTKFVDLNNVVQLTSGTYHVCARQSTGSVKCWGDNEYGQLGNYEYKNYRTHAVPFGDK